LSAAPVGQVPDFLEELRWRGLLQQATDESLAREALAHPATAPVRAYVGFDPSAASLHVGSLLPILALRRLQLAGHAPIALVGGGTGMIGDPSGKSAERKLLSNDDVRANATALEAQLRRLLPADGHGHEPIFVNNLDWLNSLSVIDFLRDYGKFFSVNAMMQRDSVRTRLEERDQGISYTEFSYMLLQAYDFLVLFRDHGCRAQIGGSDQWGNILSGLDLIHRLNPHPATSPGPAASAPFGLTMPLLTTRSGQKFGKTEAGTVWLDPHLTSPYQFYQFWMHADDAEVATYLRYFTFLSQPEVETVVAAHTTAPERRQAQRTLAHAVTTYVHGAEATEHAAQASALLFGGGDVREVPAAALDLLRAELPFAQKAWPDSGATVAVALTGEGAAFASNGEAKRALAAGSVSLNGHKLGADLQAPFARESLLHERFAFVRVGKKQFFLVEFSG